MQKQIFDLNDTAMIRVPWALLDEIGLDPAIDAMQLFVRRGRLVIEPIEGEQSRACLGACCRCPGRDTCEDAFR